MIDNRPPNNLERILIDEMFSILRHNEMLLFGAISFSFLYSSYDDLNKYGVIIICKFI